MGTRLNQAPRGSGPDHLGRCWPPRRSGHSIPVKFSERRTRGALRSDAPSVRLSNRASQLVSFAARCRILRTAHRTLSISGEGTTPFIQRSLPTERRSGLHACAASPASSLRVVIAALMGSRRPRLRSASKCFDRCNGAGAGDERASLAKLTGAGATRRCAQTVLRKSVSLVAAVILSVLSSAASSAARRSIAAS